MDRFWRTPDSQRRPDGHFGHADRPRPPVGGNHDRQPDRDGYQQRRRHGWFLLVGADPNRSPAHPERAAQTAEPDSPGTTGPDGRYFQAERRLDQDHDRRSRPSLSDGSRPSHRPGYGHGSEEIPDHQQGQQ